MWNLTFAEDLPHAEPHFMSLCILPDKHFFPFCGRGSWGLERSDDVSSGGCSPLTDSLAVLCAYIVSSEKIGFWFHTWVISSWGIGPSPYPLPCWFTAGTLGKELVLTQQSYPLPSTHNFNLPFLQILLLHFTAKENGSAIQIPSYGSWLYYRPWDIHLLSIGLTFWDWDWKK